MWFSLFAVILILAMTFFQGLQGLFTAAITCALTILSAALAFGLYEDVYFAQLMAYQPDHGRAIALMAIFIISLLLLRTLFDLFIKGNMHFSIYVDRIGGGALGFITAMITVGTLAIGLQMLPFGPSFLGFSRYALVDTTGKAIEPAENATNDDVFKFRSLLDWSKVKPRRRSLWLSPDGFTASLIAHLSANALHGGHAISEIYPDLLRDIHNARSGAFAGTRHTVPPDSLTVEGYWDMPPKAFYVVEPVNESEGFLKSTQGRQVRLNLCKEPLDPGLKRIVVRATIKADARDEDNVHRFTTEQMRLFALDSKTGPPKEYFLAGASSEMAARWVKLYPGESITRSPKDALKIDLVFEVPDKPEFKPLFLEYKQNARVELVPAMDKSKEPPQPLAPPKKPGPPEGSLPPGEKTGEEQTPGGESTSPRQDRISGLGPTREGIFSKEMPFKLTKYDGRDIELGGSELRGGHLRAQLSNNGVPEEGTDPAIETFQVPDNMRLLQISVEKLQPQSWLGSIYGGIIDKVQDFYLVDASGKEYMPVGSYAMAKVSGKPVFELIYLEETARGFARLPKFDRIRSTDLKGDYTLFFLFHVPPGTMAEKIHTGRTNVDLTPLNLVSPK